jgi:hypothetical protein
MEEVMKPTPEEEANGWTEESLTRYIRERDLANAEVVLGDLHSRRITKNKQQPTKANNSYSPHKWREV